jgi:U5 snRNP spliceosome subunit
MFVGAGDPLLRGDPRGISGRLNGAAAAADPMWAQPPQVPPGPPGSHHHIQPPGPPPGQPKMIPPGPTPPGMLTFVFICSLCQVNCVDAM